MHQPWRKENHSWVCGWKCFKFSNQLFWHLFLDSCGTLGGGFKHFLFSPRKLGKISHLTIIFCRWVGSTTNQYRFGSTVLRPWASCIPSRPATILKVPWEKKAVTSMMCFSVCLIRLIVVLYVTYQYYTCNQLCRYNWITYIFSDYDDITPLQKEKEERRSAEGSCFGCCFEEM